MTEVFRFPDSVDDWLSQPFGQSLLAQETRLVEDVFEGIFGEQCLQIGAWGPAEGFLRSARTQRKLLIADTAHQTVPTVIGQPWRLPVESESVDCVLLPHTLEFSDRPHAMLREVDRVLHAHGHLVILGFRPGGLWGLRRLIPAAALPPGAEHLVADRRVRDWLKLLDMRIHGMTGYFFRWPVPGNRGASSQRWERLGKRFWPELSACYMLAAQKRVCTLTPVRPSWSRKPKLVAGLAEPSTRASNVARFDQNR
ncbi:MAG: methyltransferase domain-containing protein [Pseudomonadota bacterium]